MLGIPKSAFLQPPPLPPRHRSDGSVSNMLSEGGNSNTSMVGEKQCLHLNTRTRPYYFRRCKRVRSTHIESLPDDVLFHILLRLPADHLYDRARIVCRRWYHIIHSQAFVNTQVQHSTYGLLLSTNSISYSGRPIFLSATQGRIEMARFSYKSWRIILGSCNGLCLEYQMNRHCDLQIINPATKQVFVLPSLSSEDLKLDKVGIAYAAASMEYKVTVPYKLINQPTLYFFAILTVGVDNSWRHLPVESLPINATVLFSDYSLSTEGFVHWVNGNYVLTLDVETEVFTESKVPLQPVTLKRMHYLPFSRLHFLSTGRYLSMLVSPRDFLFEVWGMEPETREWRKLLPDINLEAQKCKLRRIARGRSEQVLVPLGWIKYPEVLGMMFLDNGHTCILYNLDTREINSIELPDPCGVHSFFAHKNNLMSLS